MLLLADRARKCDDNSSRDCRRTSSRDRLSLPLSSPLLSIACRRTRHRAIARRRPCHRRACRRARLRALCAKGVEPGRRRPGRAMSWAECRARRSLVVDRSSRRSSIARRCARHGARRSLVDRSSIARRRAQGRSGGTICHLSGVELDDDG